MIDVNSSTYLNMMQLKCNKFGKYDEDIQEIIDSKFKATLVTKFLNCGGYMLPDLFVDFHEDIFQLKVRNDDIWVAGYPKSGTTWTQETVWCIANDLNLKLSKKISLSERFPFLDKQFMFNPQNLSKNDTQAIQRFGIESKLQKIINSPSPRFIKSHLALEFYPWALQNNSTNAKIIFVTRNPRDVCISQYHHCQLVEGFQGTLEEFAILFMQGLVPYGPYWDNIHSFWNKRSKLNISFVRFEDMKIKPIQTIRKICKFLDKSYTDDEIYKLAEHLTFDNMKKINTINKEKFTETMKQLNNVNKEAKFMRSGQIHQWRTKLNPEMIRLFEQWEKENLKGSDFTLNYDEE